MREPESVCKEMAHHLIEHGQTPPDMVRGGVVTIGNFDGVHRGHAGLISTTLKEAHTRGVAAVALTFDPHPRELLLPNQPQPLLTTLADRIALLEHAGADHVLILRTTPELLDLSAADFFRLVIVERLRAAALVEGHNFGFGRRREGNVSTLARLCDEAGLSLTVIPQLLLDGCPVSSSQVRQALLRGAVGDANNLLGRSYRIYGVVGTGQRRGQTLGFPTANLEQITTVIPADGVYAVQAVIDGETWPAAVNLGPNPTFADQARKVEVHLIGFQGNLYGKALGIDFVQWLRDTRRFGSAAELVEQLRRDVEDARRALAVGS
jgi:riboflavin kinase / FMN adenylyltransferase